MVCQRHAKTLSLLRRDLDRLISVDVDEEIMHETRLEVPDWDEKLLCRECGQTITSPREGIEVLGAHAHTFVNPSGIVFEIGCFRIAVGCAHVGTPTREWSWFTGYSWRVVVCSSCFTHLGWFYAGDDLDSFYGLILNRLTLAR